MIDRVKNNFLGISSADKINVFYQIAYYLEENGSKKLKRTFYNRFNGYMHSIICFEKFLEDYSSFNKEYKDKILSYIMDEYVDRVRNHHEDNSPDSRRDSFIKDSSLEVMGDKVIEYVRYFRPDFVSTEEVNQAMEMFECYTDEEKNDFIKEMCDLYSRLEFFSLSISKEDLDMFKNAVFSFLSDDLKTNFELLFPEEQMKFASSVCSFYDYLGFIKKGKKNDDDVANILKYSYLKSDR